MENSRLPKRKNIRLKEYDYASNGGYFITICSEHKKKIFWENDKNNVGANCVRQPAYRLSEYGNIVDREIKSINGIYGNIIKIDKYVIMPNHIHMIIIIDDFNIGRTQFAPTVSRIVKQFKGAVTKKIGKSIWQRSFYEHIIRNDIEYVEICNYIYSNPLKWLEDEYYI